MISVSQNGLGAEISHLLHGESFDRRSSSSADESRSFDISVRGVNDTNPREI